jgi:hypothetical protein
MARHIERVTGVPVVTLTYDGTGSFQNDRILPYLRFPATRSAAALPRWREGPQVGAATGSAAGDDAAG